MRVPARRMMLTAGSATTLSAALMTGTAEAAPPLGACDALRLSPQLIGKVISVDPGPVHAGEVEIQSLSVTRTIRILRPGESAKLGFVAERLNVLVDNTNHITRVFCG
ncbi:I78 family peptidase inhibitor [Actinomadura rudentiformis]|uniref:Peptidase inhibitor I78 family protein n=1 Tax=Actinomadura rudentiformis TaxID=359158 RepID=A0A6H9Z064_9ACTN|nr:I78 family peptidase inhibitor [Actinomadura rudentiformis]KAB2352540.1 hypothetical protein F8566_02355 [Actinomadura rudentiformis]